MKLLLGFSAEDEAAVALMSETGGGGLSITPGSQNLIFFKVGWDKLILYFEYSIYF